MRRITTRQTSVFLLALAWLALVPMTSRLVAQSFYNAEEALEEAEYQADEIRSQALRGTKLVESLRQSAEDADFRSQGKLFRKLHALIEVIEDEAFAIDRHAREATRHDPRIEATRLRELSVNLDTQARFVDMTLRDAANAFHEGKTPQALQFLREAGLSLGAMRILAQSAGDEARFLKRSI